MQCLPALAAGFFLSTARTIAANSWLPIAAKQGKPLRLASPHVP